MAFNTKEFMENEWKKEMKKSGLTSGKLKGKKEVKKELKLLDGKKNKLSWGKNK